MHKNCTKHYMNKNFNSVILCLNVSCKKEFLIRNLLLVNFEDCSLTQVPVTYRGVDKKFLDLPFPQNCFPQLLASSSHTVDLTGPECLGLHWLRSYTVLVIVSPLWVSIPHRPCVTSQVFYLQMVRWFWILCPLLDLLCCKWVKYYWRALKLKAKGVQYASYTFW